MKYFTSRNVEKRKRVPLEILIVMFKGKGGDEVVRHSVVGEIEVTVALAQWVCGRGAGLRWARRKALEPN